MRTFRLSNLSVRTAFGIGLGTAAIVTPIVVLAAELANVNGKVITEKDLASYLGGYNEAQREQLLSDTVSKNRVLAQVIDQELLYQQAVKEKLNESKDYKDALAAFEKQYLAGMLVERKVGPQVTDAASRKFYKENAPRYSTSQVHVQHILLDSEKEALSLLQSIRKSNADFQEMAEKYSKDPSVKNNRGDLGYFPRGRFSEEFTEAAFNSKEGEITGPVKTAFGYHLIKVVDLKPGKTLNFDEVELRVRGDLRQRMVQDMIAGIKKAAKITTSSK